MEALYNRLCASSTLLNAWKVVKTKGSSGGIDGISIQEFDEHIGEHIQEIQRGLKSHTWVPEPYLRVYIPKKDNEKRKLGLLCIKDKIVQQAIKQLIEPRFEKVFVPNSYAYRPEKGHARAIKYTHHCCRNSKKSIILRLDIDNYFDNIDYEILFRRIRPVIADEEIIRLVELCVRMGVVSNKLQWNSISKGVPQGAVLSPILANFYLHSFDQYVLTRTDKYVRYADDFIIFCDTVEQAQDLLVKGSAFLKERLKLELNEPYIGEIKNGFEFLGIQLDNKNISITEEKRQILCSRIQELDWHDKGFSQEGLKHLQGIRNYYGVLLPQTYLQALDEVLITRLREVISQRWQYIPNKTTLVSALKSIVFFADETLLQKVSIKNELVNYYLMQRMQQRHDDNVRQNQKLIRRKKQEYRKKESESTELLVNTYGTFIGVSQKGISVKVFGKQKTMPPTHNLRHITILSNGVSISSNAISYCIQRHIPIDYFGANGQHIASILSHSSIETSLWNKQAQMPREQRAELAKRIIVGKIKNQKNLINYFHKYHKGTSAVLRDKYEEVIPRFSEILNMLSQYQSYEDDYREKIMQWEAAAALLYWGYIKELTSDDEIGFTGRHRQGATDLMNCLLNYGYAILYARVWQAILAHKMNPGDSVLHVAQRGKPTFVFDVVELFRAQAVDRVVISLVQKGESLDLNKGQLSSQTKKLLVQNIIERLNRYEVYRSKETRFEDIISCQVKDMAAYISEKKVFKPYIAKW